MIKNYKIEYLRHKDEIFGFILSFFILCFAFSISKDPDFENGYNKSHIPYIAVLLLAVSIALLYGKKYVNDAIKWDSYIKYETLNSCRNLAMIHCEVLLIHKYLKSDNTAEYEVFFKDENDKLIHSVIVDLENGDVLLRSKYFLFSQEYNNIVVSNLDDGNYDRSYTMVPVICFGDAKLREGSRFLNEFIKFDEKFYFQNNK